MYDFRENKTMYLMSYIVIVESISLKSYTGLKSNSKIAHVYVKENNY